MGKFSIFLFVLFFTCVTVFAIFNKELITVRIPFGEAYEVPAFALILLSTVVGMIAMFVYFAIRDTKKLIDNWQSQKRQKQDIKIQEMYSKALNSILAHNEAAAREALEGILAEEPDHVDALLRLGDTHASEGEYQKANTAYLKARMINPQNIETLFAIENVFEKTARWSEALKCLEDILEIDDGNLTAMYRKRTILERLGRWDELVFLQKAIVKNEHTEKDKKRENQNLIGYEYEYGRYSLENNQLEKAKKAFKAVLRMEKDFVPATLGLAEVMLREGEDEEAVNLLEKAYEASSSMIVLARLEDLLIGLGEPSRLIGIYRSSISRNPNDPVTKFLLGKLFYRLEMIDDAFEIFSGIDTGSIQYPELHLLLGNLYMRGNQPEKAANEYRKVIEIKKASRLPYCCRQCGHTSDDWSGRCPDCRQWNTYRFNLDGACSTMFVGT